MEEGELESEWRKGKRKGKGGGKEGKGGLKEKAKGLKGIGGKGVERAEELRGFKVGDGDEG